MHVHPWFSCSQPHKVEALHAQPETGSYFYRIRSISRPDILETPSEEFCSRGATLTPAQALVTYVHGSMNEVRSIDNIVIYQLFLSHSTIVINTQSAKYRLNFKCLQFTAGLVMNMRWISR